MDEIYVLDEEIESKKYKIESEGKIFEVIIILSSTITIRINEIDTMEYMYYYNEYSLESLIKINKIFKVCETITDAYETIVEIIESKKCSIKLNKNKIILILEIQLPSGKSQNVEFDIYKKVELNQETIIERLVKKVTILEEKNKNLEVKNHKLEEDIKDIKQWKKKIEKFFNDKVKEEEIDLKIGIKSLIIENIKDLNFLKDRLKIISSNFEKKNIIFNLLYRATRDGDNFNNFHLRVDNKNSTLTIIKTKLGYIFGVYFDIPINPNRSVKDDKSFIFSLSLKKIYNSNKSGTYNLIRAANDQLLNLNYQPLLININCLSNNKSYTTTSAEAKNSFSNFEKDYELNNNEKYFSVAEMETFQVSFN